MENKTEIKKSDSIVDKIIIFTMKFINFIFGDIFSFNSNMIIGVVVFLFYFLFVVLMCWGEGFKDIYDVLTKINIQNEIFFFGLIMKISYFIYTSLLIFLIAFSRFSFYSIQRFGVEIRKESFLILDIKADNTGKEESAIPKKINNIICGLNLENWILKREGKEAIKGKFNILGMIFILISALISAFFIAINLKNEGVFGYVPNLQILLHPLIFLAIFYGMLSCISFVLIINGMNHIMHLDFVHYVKYYPVATQFFRVVNRSSAYSLVLCWVIGCTFVLLALITFEISVLFVWFVFIIFMVVTYSYFTFYPYYLIRKKVLELKFQSIGELERQIRIGGRHTEDILKKIQLVKDSPVGQALDTQVFFISSLATIVSIIVSILTLCLKN